MISLRKPNQQDRADLKRLLTDAQVRLFLGGPVNAKDLDRRVEQILNSANTRRVLTLHEQFAGMVAWSAHSEEPGLEISYQLLPEFQGKGIAYYGLGVVLNHLPRPIIAETQIQNTRSRALLKRHGFREIRVIKRHDARQVIATLT